ncbi:hypothetical protein G7B40_003570 [Aetokthonos hydrillicola Thurmond2011]|uniref:Uncharacterized protein n=1 Tax=Aetokthonos hydrillicola Thurmond2011 TaxID=2712845 RepID=A0AAP5M3D3_9CYAN|nr:hypothetical protein [Aetokthonos hydrillicola Thurmond2011]
MLKLTRSTTIVHGISAKITEIIVGKIVAEKIAIITLAENIILGDITMADIIHNEILVFSLLFHLFSDRHYFVSKCSRKTFELDYQSCSLADLLQDLPTLSLT